MKPQDYVHKTENLKKINVILTRNDPILDNEEQCYCRGESVSAVLLCRHLATRGTVVAHSGTLHTAAGTLSTLRATAQ